MERRDCERFARGLDRPWFVLEYPQGYTRDLNSITKASCGVGGHMFMNDGQIEDESCLHGQEYYGSANKFALYSLKSQFLKINITVDTVPQDFVVFHNESIDMAVESFVKRFELESEPEAIRALREMARMKLSGVRLLKPTQEELQNSYIATKSHQVWERLRGASKVIVADDLLGEASMVRCIRARQSSTFNHDIMIHNQYRIRDESEMTKLVFKDRSRFWVTQYRLMWKETASLSIILKSIVRESITDELMNRIGLFRVYENTWPASLCVSSSTTSPSSSSSSHDDKQCSSSSCRYDQCHGERILGIVQDYRSSVSSSLGDLRTLYRSGRFNETISTRPHIDRTSFEHTVLFYFISGHPDLHGGNILLREDGKLTCIDVDMAWSGSPGCLMGPLQMPCVFGAVRWYSSESVIMKHC